MHANVLAVAALPLAALWTGTALGLAVVPPLAPPSPPKSTEHVVHERRQVPHARLTQRMAPNTVLPMRIGLRQNSAALAAAEDWLMEVSHPASPRYGQHWSADEVVAAFRPSDEAVATVVAWLVEEGGIARDRLTHSDNKAWLAFDATVDEAERLLHTEYLYDDNDDEEGHVDGTGSAVGCNEYHLPKHVQAHVDYVTPGLKTTMMDLRPSRAQKRAPLSKSSSSSTHSRTRRPQGLDKFKPRPDLAALSSSSSPSSSRYGNTSQELANCDELITPACLRALYHFDAPSPNATVAANNSLGIFEEGDFYAQADFDLFFAKYTPYIANGTHPTLDSVDGGEAPVATADAGGESDLDFELAYPM